MVLFLLHGAVFGLDAAARAAAAVRVRDGRAVRDRSRAPPAAERRSRCPGIVVGLICEHGAAARASSTRSSASLIGGGVLWLIGEAYYRYSGQEGMGGGDVKMLAMIGAFLGWKLVLVTLVLSSVAGSLDRPARDRRRNAAG